MPKEKEDKLGPFIFHGVDLTLNGTQAIGDCPFCHKESKFYVSPKNGMYDCKVCGEKGNSYTFITKLFEASLDATSKSELKEIASIRRLPVDALDGTVAKDINGRGWLLPVWNGSGSLANLAVWEGKGSPVYFTTGLAHHLGYASRLDEDKESEVFICEGQWDADALHWLLCLKLELAAVVIYTPGANIWKDAWTEKVKNRKVTLVFDNDDAGKTGQTRITEKIAGSANAIRSITWPSKAPAKYDINDFVSDRITAPSKAWKELQGMLEDCTSLPENIERVNPVLANTRSHTGKPPKFETVIKEFRKQLHLDAHMVDALSIVFASALAIRLPGDPIWLFLVGPPGVGKSLVLQSFVTAKDHCHFESTLSPNALISGMAGPNGEDLSLLPKVQGKILILKDYTTLRSLPAQFQELVYGILRDSYDGRCSRPLANGLIRAYENLYFGVIAGVTHTIHGDNRASLGERFLKCEFIGPNHDNEKHIRAAMDGMDTLVASELKLREITHDFIDRVIDYDRLPKIPDWATDRIVAISQVIAVLRASVERSTKGEMSYRPIPEVATRLGKQLKKLARCLAMVFGKSAVDKECYRLVEKVAFDSSTGWHLDIVRTLITYFPTPATKNELARLSHISPSSIDRKLDDLIELRAVNVIRLPANGKGQPALGYTLSKHIYTLWQRAKVGK